MKLESEEWPCSVSRGLVYGTRRWNELSRSTTMRRGMADENMAIVKEEQVDIKYFA